MKTLILSDLHDDFWADKGRDPFAPCVDLLEGTEAIVLAGDISNKPKVRWKYAFGRLRDRFGDIPIYAFPGNHDFYDWRLRDEDRLVDFAREFDVSYAQMKTLYLGKTRLICATLWTDLELGRGRVFNERYLPTKMNDYRYIRLGGGSFRRVFPDDFLQHHRRHLAYIKAELSAPWEGPSVVVTHHAPHPDVLIDYADGVEAAYASDLSSLMKGAAAPDQWLFGHCHDAHPLRVGKTALSNISLGYPMDITSDEEIRTRIKRAIFDL